MIANWRLDLLSIICELPVRRLSGGVSEIFSITLLKADEQSQASYLKLQRRRH